jgi:CYTH domain-containing protein
MNIEIPNLNPQIEIERKFSIRSLPENLDSYLHEEIRQGYLVIGADGSEARVRDRDGSYTLTVKSKGNLVRGEYEIEIDSDAFGIMWPATNGRRVEKTRVSIPHGQSIIELDIYYGELMGLVTAEVEFNSKGKAEEFQVPEWFGEDITYNSSYKNQALADEGYPTPNIN